MAGVTGRDGTDLVRAAAAGDELAFTELVDLHIDRCYAVARRITGSREAAEEATQEALVAAWRDLPRLSDPDRFAAWLYRILARQCYRTVRWYRRLPGLHRGRHAETDDDRAFDWDLAAPVRGVGFEERDELAGAFETLSVEHRAVVALHFYLDLPLVEVARALDIAPGTARSRLHYALRHLRTHLDAVRGSEGLPVSHERGGRRP